MNHGRIPISKSQLYAPIPPPRKYPHVPHCVVAGSSSESSITSTNREGQLALDFEEFYWPCPHQLKRRSRNEYYKSHPRRPRGIKGKQEKSKVDFTIFHMLYFSLDCFKVVNTLFYCKWVECKSHILSLWSMIVWTSVDMRHAVCGDTDWHFHNLSRSDHICLLSKHQSISPQTQTVHLRTIILHWLILFYLWCSTGTPTTLSCNRIADSFHGYASFIG